MRVCYQPRYHEYYLIFKLFELIVLLDRKKPFDILRIKYGRKPYQVIQEEGQNPHSFFNVSHCSLGSLFVRNGRDDLSGVKLFQSIPEPDKVTIPAAYAPSLPICLDLKLQEARGSESHESSGELSFRTKQQISYLLTSQQIFMISSGVYLLTMRMHLLMDSNYSSTTGMLQSFCIFSDLRRRLTIVSLQFCVRSRIGMWRGCLHYQHFQLCCFPFLK